MSNTIQSNPIKSSTLYVVATPIGNLSDITHRAQHVLVNVDCVAAEDTRHTRQLFQRLNIQQEELISLHDHNERARVEGILSWLEQGRSIALVSDAGTPAISDPGYFLVKSVREAGYDVVPVPGASAVIAALSAAGLPTDGFIFDGFLPAKSKSRCDVYRKYLHESRTVVLYESSHRIQSSLSDLITTLGEHRTISVCRELTKLYETFLSGSASDVLEAIEADHHQQKGEFVILIQGVKDESATDHTILSILKPLLEELPPKQAASLTSKITGCRKKEAYNLALSLK